MKCTCTLRFWSLLPTLSPDIHTDYKMLVTTRMTHPRNKHEKPPRGKQPHKYRRLYKQVEQSLIYYLQSSSSQEQTSDPDPHHSMNSISKSEKLI